MLDFPCSPTDLQTAVGSPCLQTVSETEGRSRCSRFRSMRWIRCRSDCLDDCFLDDHPNSDYSMADWDHWRKHGHLKCPKSGSFSPISPRFVLGLATSTRGTYHPLASTQEALSVESHPHVADVEHWIRGCEVTLLGASALAKRVDS